MRVRFSRGAGIMCLAAAALFGALAVVAEHVSFMGVVVPFAFFAFGLAFLTRPYVLVDDQSITVHALMGSARETCPLQVSDTLEFKGSRVVLVRGDERRTLAATRWVAHRRDWTAFRAWAARRADRHADGHQARAVTASGSG
jgi:hypothetical protein